MQPSKAPALTRPNDSADHHDEDEEHEVECDEGGDAGLEEREEKDKIPTGEEQIPI